MKTLDEVIELSERCTLPYPGDCLNCEYFEDETGYDCRCKIIADALHYLKVLKDILDPLNVKKISHEITCPQCNSVIAILLPESNEPLTWDELKQMEGKPVWVEEKDMPSTWIIIWDVTENWLYPTGCDAYRHEEYGKTWQAYREERE